MHCYIRQHFRLESSHVIHSEPKKKGEEMVDGVMTKWLLKVKSKLKQK